MRFFILGPVEAFWNGVRLPVVGRKRKAILASLLLHHNRVVPAEALVDQLWGESPPASATNTLYSHMSYLRRSLGPAADVLVSQSPGYLLRVDPESIDLVRFERLAAAGRAALAKGQPEGAAELLAQALALWRGRPLSDVGGLEFAEREAARLDESRLSTLEHRLNADLALGHHEELIAELLALLSEHPLREGLAGQLMVALYRSGRQGEALRVYRELERVLGDELGIKPTAELARMEEAILLQNNALDWTPPAERPLPRVDALGQPPSSVRLDLAFPLSLGTASSTPVVGREAVLDELVELITPDPVRLRAQVVLLSGEAGVGKTRLLAEITSRAYGGGATVLHGRCDPEEVVPFQPIVEALRPLLRADPESLRACGLAQLALLITPVLAPGSAGAPASVEPETDRLRFFQAMAELLMTISRIQPIVLALDDVQWLDASSAALCRDLSRKRDDHSITTIACFRSDAARYSGAWERLLGDLRHVEECSLFVVEPLSRESVASLVSHLLPEARRQEAPVIAARIFPAAGGNPLFVREVIAALAATGDDGTGTSGVPAPTTLVASVVQRLRLLPSASQHILRAAAVLGQEFPLDDVASVAASGPDDVLAAMDEARELHLVDEVRGQFDRFAFHHALVRQSIYDTLTTSRRVRLHFAAGQACEGRGDPDSILSRGVHLLEAVPFCPPDLACRAVVAAADAALGRFAFEETLALCSRASELLATGKVAGTTQVDVLLRTGRAQAYAGDSARSEGSFAEAATIARRLGDPERLAAAALGDDSETRALNPSPERLALLKEALAGLGQDHVEVWVSVASALATAGSIVGTSQEFSSLADEAVAVARELGHKSTVARALIAWLTCNNTSVDPLVRLEVATEALSKAEAADDERRAARARLLRVGALVRVGRAGEAEVEHDLYRVQSGRSRLPRHLWQADVVGAGLARLRGQFDAADKLAVQAASTGRRFKIAEADMAFGVHLFFTELHHGRLAGLYATLNAFAEARPDLLLWRLGAAAAALAGCDHSAARRALDDWVGVLPNLDPEHEFWSDQLMLGAQLAADLSAGPVVSGFLLERLRHLCGQFEVFGAMAGTFGPVDRALGVLEVQCGDIDAACEWLRSAGALCDSMKAVPWAVWSYTDLADALRLGGRTKEAEVVADEWRGTAESFGMVDHAQRLARHSRP